MGDRTYWLDLFTHETWSEFLAAGGEVSGFRERQRRQVGRMQPGDILLCYLTGVSRFVGALEVTSEPYRDDTQIVWSSEAFPRRIHVRLLVQLTPETAVPVADLLDRFSWAAQASGRSAWTGHFRSSPRAMDAADGEMVLEALSAAERAPITRPVNPRRLGRRPTATASAIGPVVIPDADLGSDDTEAEAPATRREATAHTEIQWLLLKLGSDMGLDVWVARNDRSREYRGKRFDALPRLRSDLPRQFDPLTSSTISLIDVLWLDKNSIEAAFEIESTTSIYSGLLRMADLIALQPNLKIPLYIAAPDDRRNKVLSEVNRPVFRRLDPPMAAICRFLPFSTLRDNIAKVAPFVRRVDPAIVLDWAESCEVDEE